MDYKITCICGHQFIVSDETLRTLTGGTINCPACHQRLSPAIEMPTPKPPDTASTGLAPDSAAPPAMGEAFAPMPPATDLEPTKRCPFCGEVILAIARKCKHCGEFLDRAAPNPLSPTPPGNLAPATPHAPGGAGNDPVFALTISQWDNFWRFLIIFTGFAAFAAFLLGVSSFRPFAPAGILCALVPAALAAGYFYVRARSTRISIRPMRIEVEKGIFNKNMTALELFRVNDISLQQGFIPRILGFGTIKLTTTDADSPEMLLFQIPRAREVRHYLQTQVPIAARQRGAVYMEK